MLSLPEITILGNLNFYNRFGPGLMLSGYPKNSCLAKDISS
jgi:hypothetical protein